MELNNFKVNAITQNSDYLILGLLNGEIVIYNSDNIDFINLDIYQEGEKQERRRKRFMNPFIFQFGFISESMFRQSGLTISINSLYLCPIPLGKHILGMLIFLQNFTIS